MEPEINETLVAEPTIVAPVEEAPIVTPEVVAEPEIIS